MKITSIEWGRISIPLRTPFKTALRTVASVEDIIVKLTADTGETAFGEAPPTGVITGDTSEAICGAIEHHIAPAILGWDMDDFQGATQRVQSALVHNTSAKAAVDMALWDLYGKKLKTPVFRLLGGGKTHIMTDITVSVNPPEVMARDAEIAVQRGFDCIKVKVGVNPALDVARLAAIRAAVPAETVLRIDANQAWTPKEAVRILNGMQEKGLDIELVEQPVKAHDLDGLKYVTERSFVPVLADESVFSPMDAMNILQMGAADLVNIKLMKCGGITNALKITTLAELYGAECMIGCMLEGPVAVNAAAHLACARGVITKFDLDGPMLCAGNPVHGGSRFESKDIYMCEDAGLGVSAVDGIVPLGALA
ncbi:MAG: dipeptide epimerase [Clostridia bacterium]|nr:dipeptide epimerase [Clostridia bacterium]